MILERPIVFLDIESTGLDKEKDRIVEICAVKTSNIIGNDFFEIKTRRLNPGIPIPPGATEIHGITDEMVKDCPSFAKVGKGLMDFMHGCDIGGYNIYGFDLPILYFEFMRAGIYWDYNAHYIIDVANIFKIKEPRDLTAAVKFYCDEDLQNAHGAESDTVATAKVFINQMKKYDEFETSNSEDLALFSNYGKKLLDVSGKFTFNDKDEIILNFGKHRGELASRQPGFLQWMIDKKFPSDTVKICYDILNQQP